MDRTGKEQAVTALNQNLTAAEGVILTKNLGLNAESIYALRNKVRAADARVVVAKNRLTVRALSGTQFEGLKDQLKGPTALIISKDTVAAAKVIVAFAKDNDRLQLVSGVMGKDMFDAKGVEALSKLPGINELRATLIGLLQAPASKIARVLQAPAGQLARVVQAHADKGNG